MTVWDGDTMADAIGRALEREGFVPFGVGLPFAAERAARQWLTERISPTSDEWEDDE